MAGTLGHELRDARLGLGLSQSTVARASGLSASRIGRLERHETQTVDLDELCRLARPLGLRPSVKLFPAGVPLRDAAHLALLRRLESVLGPRLQLRREVPIPISGDLRGWDGWLQAPGDQLELEAETHVRDVQDLERRIAHKLRDDDRVSRVLLVLTESVHNRRVAREKREALRELHPLEGHEALRALRAGRLPGAGGVVLL